MKKTFSGGDNTIAKTGTAGVTSCDYVKKSKHFDETGSFDTRELILRIASSFSTAL